MAEECQFARPENFKRVLRECKYIIEHDFKPYGLEDKIKKCLCDLTIIWERKNILSKEKGVEIGGLRVIFAGLLRSVELAKYLSKRYNKDVYYYLKRICSGIRDQDLGFINYCCSMWNLK